jgi:hypothetical protein
MTVAVAGSTDKTVYFQIVEDSAGTNPGEPKTGLAFGDVSSASYARNGAARVAITPITQTVAGAHSDGGFIEVDATNMPGLYRFDIPDAAIATGADSVIIQLVTGSNSIAAPLEIDLNIADAVLDGATIAELAQAAPAATPTLAEAVMLLYMALRNKREDIATEMRIFNDAGTVITRATLSDDATTFTKEELTSGP